MVTVKLSVLAPGFISGFHPPLPPPPSHPPPLRNWVSLFTMWLPPGFVFPPPLNFGTRHVPPLEQNPEMNTVSQNRKVDIILD